MTARQSRPIHGTYENREEYHFHDATQQQAKAHAALSDIEHILSKEDDYRALSLVNGGSYGFRHDYKKGIETLELQVTSSELEVPTEGILYVKGDRQFMRKVIGYQAITKQLLIANHITINHYGILLT